MARYYGKKGKLTIASQDGKEQSVDVSGFGINNAEQTEVSKEYIQGMVSGTFTATFVGMFEGLFAIPGMRFYRSSNYRYWVSIN